MHPIIDSTRRKISTPTIIPNKPFFPFYLPPSLNCGVPSPTTPISNSSLLNIYILLKEKKKHLIPYDQDRTPLKKLLDGKKIHSKGKKKKKGKILLKQIQISTTGFPLLLSFPLPKQKFSSAHSWSSTPIPAPTFSLPPPPRVSSTVPIKGVSFLHSFVITFFFDLICYTFDFFFRNL